MFLIHDYVWAEGVRKAVQEFFSTRPETILELAGAYCGIVKLYSRDPEVAYASRQTPNNPMPNL